MKNGFKKISVAKNKIQPNYLVKSIYRILIAVITIACQNNYFDR